MLCLCAAHKKIYFKLTSDAKIQPGRGMGIISGSIWGSFQRWGSFRGVYIALPENVLKELDT